MPVPPYQDLLQPIVRILSSEGEELSKDQLVERLVVELVLNEHDAHERLPSGSGTILEHNIDWARSHLQMQGLIEGRLKLLSANRDGISAPMFSSLLIANRGEIASRII